MNIVPTEACPCEGKHAWNWHKERGIDPCRHARDVKYGNYNRWKKKVEDEHARVKRVLNENPALIPWIAGASIYLDEEERSA